MKSMQKTRLQMPTQVRAAHAGTKSRVPSTLPTPTTPRQRLKAEPAVSLIRAEADTPAYASARDMEGTDRRRFGPSRHRRILGVASFVLSCDVVMELKWLGMERVRRYDHQGKCRTLGSWSVEVATVAWDSQLEMRGERVGAVALDVRSSASLTPPRTCCTYITLSTSSERRRITAPAATPTPTHPTHPASPNTPPPTPPAAAYTTRSPCSPTRA